MLNLYTKLVANILFPVHERLKKHSTVSVRKKMEETQWWTQSEIERLQLQRLQKLLSHAAQHVPYYKKLFSEISFIPDDINSINDLQKLPFLSKEIIRGNIDNLKADNAKGLAKFNTGGSSGAPLIFYIGNERVSHDVAAKWRATRWWNVDIGDPEIVVWGSPIELSGQDKVKQIRDKLMRTELISAFEMSEPNLDKFVQRILNFKPKMLFGYPSSLSLVAKHAEKRNIDVSNLGVKVAFVTSEKLYDHQRENIENIFNCKVANGYGGRDAGFIAHQCPAGGMHITAEDIIVEIVDSQGNVVPVGESGEIVITNLATQDFPFIRYKIGDIGVLSDKACSCGRGLPLLAEVQGRSTDFIVTPDGQVMHGLALIYVLRDVPTVQNFKITQESKQQIEVQIQVNELYDEKDESKILRELKQRLGEGIEISLNKVDKIEKEKSGKFRYVVSKVNPFE